MREVCFSKGGRQTDRQRQRDTKRQTERDRERKTD